MPRRRDPGGERGQGIAYVLVLSAALLVFVIAIVDLLWTESRMITKARKNQELFHEVDGAVDRALYALLKEGNWEAVPQGLVPGYQADVTFDDIPGMRYRLKVQEGNWTPYDPSMGSEASWTPAGDTDNERTVTVYASRTQTGERKKLQAVVLRSSLRSALFSGGQIQVKGSADVHWGPVVSYDDVTVPAIDLTKGIPTHPIFLAAGDIYISGVSAGTLGKDSSDPQAGVSVDEWSTNIGKIPSINYEYYKVAAQANTVMDGDYNDKADYYRTGECQPSDQFPSPMADSSVLFYDTLDAEPWDNANCYKGSGNGVRVNLTGNVCGKGVLVVMGTLDSQGTGCVNSITMTPPPDCYPRFDSEIAGCAPVTNPKLWWDGLVIVSGALISSGNKKMYGSIFANDTAGITGSFEIWYKTSNEQLGMLGKTVAVRLWMPRRPFTTGPAEPFPD